VAILEDVFDSIAGPDELAQLLVDALDWPPLDEALDQIVADGHPTPTGWTAVELDGATADPTALTDAQLIDTITGFDRLTSWAGARQARLLAEFATRRPADARDRAPRGAPTLNRWAPDEIALAMSISRPTAASRLAQATRLVTTLPATLDAYEAGRIDAAKVRAICDATAHLPDEDARWVQDRVLPAAPARSRAQLVAALARAVIAVDPEGANARHRKARTDRRVVVGQEDDGMASLWALLAAPDALAAHQWLTRLAHGLGTSDPRPMDQRRADLLVALLTGTLIHTQPDRHGGEPRDDDAMAEHGSNAGDGTDDSCGVTGSSADSDGADPSGSALIGSPESSTSRPSRTIRSALQPVNPGKPLVHVVMQHSTLAGEDHRPAELVGYGPVPADLAREIAADAVWKRLVTDPLSGALLDHGRTTYRPPAALSDFVRARDVYCRSPLCRRRALDSELDHTVPFPVGPTAEYNLTDGCLLHHHEKHSPGWSVTQHRDGTVRWTTPTGHTYRSGPFDYRPDPPPPRAAVPDAEPRPRRQVARGPQLGSWWRTAVAAPDDDPPPF
jgi:hypothetical protein